MSLPHPITVFSLGLLIPCFLQLTEREKTGHVTTQGQSCSSTVHMLNFYRKMLPLCSSSEWSELLQQEPHGSQNQSLKWKLVDPGLRLKHIILIWKIFFEIVSLYVLQADNKLMILLVSTSQVLQSSYIVLQSAFEIIFRNPNWQSWHHRQNQKMLLW